MLRIIAGSRKGRKISAPPGLGTRPTSDKVREAIFSILGPVVEGVRAADFFAGSGALGLEALSRGARWCLFVEHSRKVASVLENNAAGLDLTEHCLVMVDDAVRPSRKIVDLAPFDLIFADPPYERGLVHRFMQACERDQYLAPGGSLVVEHSPNERPENVADIKLKDQRKYGQTEVSFFTRYNPEG